ncbi:MAG: pyridoxamine 5'-phosphate oxidase family protein [Chloroflexota bacterium]
MSTKDSVGSPRSDGETSAKVKATYQALLTSHQSATLATVSADGSPLASYTPFAVDADMTFYIFISGLAQHTANLEHNPLASLMLIADEAATKQIFARPRLTFDCQASKLARDSNAWQEAASLYEARFSNFFKLIRDLQDFSMYKLIPLEGVLVAGFGQAFTVSGDKLDQLTLRRG